MFANRCITGLTKEVEKLRAKDRKSRNPTLQGNLLLLEDKAENA